MGSMFCQYLQKTWAQNSYRQAIEISDVKINRHFNGLSYSLGKIKSTCTA